MIDKIFEMIMKEARTREGEDLSWKLFYVLTELDAKLMEKFEELNPDFMVWLPDDPEELAKPRGIKYLKNLRRNHDR